MRPKYELVPLWSYVKMINGNYYLFSEIVLNIIMFVPLGFFLGCGTSSKLKRCIGCLMLISFTIEILQLVFHLGLCEIDDILNNTIGGGIGLFFSYYFKRTDHKSFKQIITTICLIGSVVVCLLVGKSESIAEKELCFQVVAKNKSLQGVCFVLGKNTPDEYSIILKNDSDTTHLLTQTGIEKPDVNSYFESEYNYLLSGFTADISFVQDGTYEIFVDFKRYGLKETGCYLVDGEVKYSIDSGLQTNNEITENGYLLVAQKHCYVYQYQGNLYWFMDEEYPFEEDDTTLIQYQLWTTQPDRLPQKRRNNGWDWDNVGFNFEEYEIGSIGNYRVAMRPLPTEYSITAIVTGYHKDGKWIWQKYFRPMISELMN